MKTAYLYGKLDEEVYMDVPEGLEGIPEDYVLKLEKALYGLKQAGHCHCPFPIFYIFQTLYTSHVQPLSLTFPFNPLCTNQAKKEQDCH